MAVTLDFLPRAAVARLVPEDICVHTRTMTEKAIILLSGGLDSAVALFWALSQGWEIKTIELNYHKRPERESWASTALRKRAGISPANSMVVPIDFIREVSDIPKDIPVTGSLFQSPRGYIPARNLVFYSLCAYYAELLGVQYIIGGHIQRDSATFPDADAAFFRQFNRLLKTGIWSYPHIQLEILLPFIQFGKTEVIRLGHGLGVPFELTWSCYDDGEIPCKSCKSCNERRNAFEAAGLRDPLI